MIAQIAKDAGVLTVGVVTRPFLFEASRRRKQAEQGIKNLREAVDTLITIPNQRLVSMSDPSTTLVSAFQMADRVLLHAVRGVADLINQQGFVNVDFADVQTIMQNMGKAVIGKGTAAGKDRMNLAMQDALQSSLMDDVDIRGAKGILVHVLGPADTSAFEISEAMGAIENLADEDVNLIWGATFDEKIEDYVTITIIATGLDH